MTSAHGTLDQPWHGMRTSCVGSHLPVRGLEAGVDHERPPEAELLAEREDKDVLSSSSLVRPPPLS